VLFESRLLCASCLQRNSAESSPANRELFGLGGFSLAIIGFLVAWALFYFAGWAVLQLRERAPLADRSDCMLQVPA
jgi:hypothetical protein